MDEVEKIMTCILMSEPGSLPVETTALRDLKGWDSLKHVLLVLEIEKALQVKLTADEIRNLVTVADVRRTLTGKAAGG
jgi:acyl carrier protein